MNVIECKKIATEIRKLSLQLAHNANSSHSGGALSMSDILAVLYSGVININPLEVDTPERDRFILSKGHCCASLYATLALKGFLSKQELLDNYGKDGTKYFSHVSHYLDGVEVSSGSLGHGLPIAAGIALSGKIKDLCYNVYCLTGDGELDEGSNWEAIMFAAQNNLSNLCLLVDYNKIQSLGNVDDIIDLAPLKDKFVAFGWNAIEIDGHDFYEIEEALHNFLHEKTCPTVVICNTVKGKGVSYMENRLAWHYKAPNNEELKQAMEELG